MALEQDWQVAGVEAGDPAFERPGSVLDGLDWIPARVPGTVAGALRAAGRDAAALDDRDWWFRTTIDAESARRDERVALCLDGIATLAEVFLDGELIHSDESMFAAAAVDVGARLGGRHELAIRCRALSPELARSRRPRARWRTRLVADNGLRWFRTTMLGRIPSFAPGPAPVGPWRPVRLERRRGLELETLELRPALQGDDGRLDVRAVIRAIDGPPPTRLGVELDGPSGGHRVQLDGRVDGDVATFAGSLSIPNVARWWPHTHGDPVLHDVRLRVGGDAGQLIEAGTVGFRTLAPGPSPDHDIDRDGLWIHVNGVPVFARGGLWMPLDIVDLTVDESVTQAGIEDARAAGMNMLRIPGYALYESDAFHDACDAAGMLVWQDLLFASMDYPFDDPAFSRVAVREVADVVGRLGGRPSTAVLCGNSEVEQQVAMLGLDLALARIPFYDETVPAIAREANLDAVYVPSSPFGGDMPMRPDRGVTGYYGLGGYRAPLSDARTSGVRFASECLAFANVPDEAMVGSLVPEPPGEAFVHHPRWKAGVPRDAGSGWDFDDLRDHYLQVVYGVDPGSLRRGDHDRYLELSRAVTGELMAYAFGEWRRAASTCHGGLVMWLHDIYPGAAYGVIDAAGHPKTAYHHLRRILAPVAVWLVDEWTGGVIAHVANDGPEPLRARLRIGLYADQEQPVGGGAADVVVPAHGSARYDVESLVGHFVDASWAFRFGPPAQDVIVATLEAADADDRQGGGVAPAILSQAFHFPAGRPLAPEPERRLGLSASARSCADGSVRLTVESRRLAYGVRIHVADFAPSDDALTIEPGGARELDLRPTRPGATFAGGYLTGLNLRGNVVIGTGADRT
jgi:beta-mannosidase